MNSVSLIGNLGQAPEYKRFQSGKRVARFSIALNGRGKDQPPTWVPCELWDDTVDRLEKCNVKSGTKIGVTGNLAQNTYTRGQGSQETTIKKLYLKVFSFDVLSPRIDDVAGEQVMTGDDAQEPEVSHEES